MKAVSQRLGLDRTWTATRPAVARWAGWSSSPSRDPGRLGPVEDGVRRGDRGEAAERGGSPHA